MRALQALARRLGYAPQSVPQGSSAVTSAESSVDSPNSPVGNELDVPENEPREECGVFGVWAPGEDVAKLSYYGLYALQHRGQEAAGIAVSDGSQVLVFKDLGLVSQVFDEQTLGAMPGHVAIGHLGERPADLPDDHCGYRYRARSQRQSRQLRRACDPGP